MRASAKTPKFDPFNGLFLCTLAVKEQKNVLHIAGKDQKNVVHIAGKDQKNAPITMDVSFSINMYHVFILRDVHAKNLEIPTFMARYVKCKECNGEETDWSYIYCI